MLTGFAIIFEDDMLYCSNEAVYTSFEIVLFVEKLITSLNPKKTWRLNNIYLKGYRMGAERMVIKHLVTEDNKNLFFCISGDFPAGSKKAYEMIDEFYDKIQSYYPSVKHLVAASKNKPFQEIVEVLTDHLWSKYEDLVEEDESRISQDANKRNNILYVGISSQGLPIISQLYDKNLLENLDVEITEDNADMYSSNISAKLATIAMNTVIRAKTNIKEIHMHDITEKRDKIILFGSINDYSLDFFASGNFSQLKLVFKKLKERISQEQILQEDFGGDLKPYRYLHDTLKDFYQEGL